MKLALALLLAALMASLMAPPAYAQVEPAENGGPDILLTALITTGVIGGAAALATMLYFLRRAIGFDWHRPPEGDEDADGEH